MLTIPDYQYITSFTNKNITLTHRYSNNKFEQKNCTVKFLHNIRILAKQYSKTVHDTGKKIMGVGIGDKMGTNVIESSDIVQVSC